MKKKRESARRFFSLFLAALLFLGTMSAGMPAVCAAQPDREETKAETHADSDMFTETTTEETDADADAFTEITEANTDAEVFTETEEADTDAEVFTETEEADTDAEVFTETEETDTDADVFTETEETDTDADVFTETEETETAADLLTETEETETYSDAGEEPECICEVICTEGEMREDCPVCGAADADVSLCKGSEAPALMSARKTPALMSARGTDPYAGGALETGELYWIDLSSVEIPESEFRSNGWLTPDLKETNDDFTMVPFRYAGRISAYVLKPASAGVADASDCASQTADPSAEYGYTYEHNLFVGDSMISGASWYELDKAGLVFGKSLASNGVSYTLRMPSCGNRNVGESVYPENNEYDVLKRTGIFDEIGLDEDNLVCWGQDTAKAVGNDSRIVRYNGGEYLSMKAGETENGAFYPVLELPDQQELSIVTLDLNGGLIFNNAHGAETVIRLVVGAGSSYKLPAEDKVGLSVYPYTLEGWRTDDGTMYYPGDTVPAGVTHLTAVWPGETIEWPETEEQLSGLSVNETYYFDLSDSGLHSSEVGDQTADKSLHWVPFSYGGTVDAYVLNHASAGQDKASYDAASTRNSNGTYGYRYEHSLFVSDDPVTESLTWNGLNTRGLIFGKSVESGGLSWTLRTPTVGQETGYGDRIYPIYNEWTLLLHKGFSAKNLNEESFLGQECASSLFVRTRTPDDRIGLCAAETPCAWRAVLEVPSGRTDADFRVVEVDLNECRIGSADGTGGTVKIIVAAGDFTAPGKEGLFMENGSSGMALRWRGDDGNLYDPGKTIPASVQTLTAVAVEQPAITKQPTGSQRVLNGQRVTLSVEATGGELKYQWQEQDDYGQWKDVNDGAGADTSSYTTEPVSGGSRRYRCVVSNSAGSVNSDTAIIMASTLSGTIQVGNDTYDQPVTDEYVKFYKASSNAPVVTINASGASSSNLSVYYYISDTQLETWQLNNVLYWNSYYLPFRLGTGRHFVYAKVNWTAQSPMQTYYMGAGGIVVYEESAADTKSVTYGYQEHGEREVSVKLNGNTIRKISDGTKTLEEGVDYRAEGGTITLLPDYLDTLDIGTHELSVSYDPQSVHTDQVTLNETTFKVEVGTYEIQDLSVTTQSVKAPEALEAVQTSVKEGDGYEAELTWDCLANQYGYNTVYTATLNLKSKQNCEFAESPEGLDGWKITEQTKDKLTLTRSFAATGKEKFAGIQKPVDVSLTEHKSSAQAVISGLPDTITIRLEGGGTLELAAEWSCSDYDTTPCAENTFTWSISGAVGEGKLEESYDRNGVAYSGSVTVTNPDPLLVVIAVNPEKTTCSYEGTVINVSELFSIDVNAGEAEYSMAEGTGEGLLSSSELTVTKAGTFRITVTTAAKGIYGAGRGTVQLTVNKGKGSARVSMADWTYGSQAPTPDAVRGTNGAKDAVYRYESVDGKGYDSEERPDQAGRYRVTAAFAETELYEEESCSAEFEITPREITVDITPNGGVFSGDIKDAEAKLNGVLEQDKDKVEVSFAYTGAANDGTLVEDTARAPEKAGVYTVTASIDNPNYRLAGETSAVFRIERAAPGLSVSPERIDATYGDPEFVLKPAYEGDGTVSYESDHPDVASVTGDGTVTLHHAGEADIIVTLAQTDNYEGAVVTVTVTVEKRGDTLKVSGLYYDVTYGDGDFTIAYDTESGRDVEITGGDGVISVRKDGQDGKLTVHILGVGEAVIKLETEPDEDYYTVSENVTVNVRPKKVTVTARDQVKTYGNPDPEFGYDVEGLVGNDQLSGLIIEREEGDDAGVYAIRISQKDGENPNYDPDFVPGKLTVEKRDIADAKISLGEALIADQTEQEQKVVRVTVTNGAGEELDATWETADNTGGEPGAYTMTVTGTGNFTGSATKRFVILPAADGQISTNQAGDAVIGKGTIRAYIQKESGAPDMELKTSKTAVIAMLAKDGSLTADELARIADGANLDVILKVTDMTGTIPESSRNQIQKAVGAGTVCQYFSISLYKQMTENGKTEEETAVARIGGKLSLSLQVPENVLNTDGAFTRTFYFARSGDGEAELLTSVFDGTEKTLTFEADALTDYALAYQDVKKAEEPEDQERSGESEYQEKPEEPEEPEKSEKPEEPENPENPEAHAFAPDNTSAETPAQIQALTSVPTGDADNPWMWLLLFCTALAALAGSFAYAKKRGKRGKGDLR